MKFYIILLSIAYYTSLYSEGKNIDYHFFQHLDTNQELLSTTLQYYSKYGSSKYRYTQIDSIFQYIKDKDSLTHGNRISFLKKDNLIKVFPATLVMNSRICFQSGFEIQNELALIKYTYSDSPQNDNLIIYDYKNNLIIDTLQDIYYYRLQSKSKDILFKYHRTNYQKYISLYNLKTKESKFFDSTNNLIDFLYIIELENIFLFSKNNFFESKCYLLDTALNPITQINPPRGDKIGFIEEQNNNLIFQIKSHKSSEHTMVYNIANGKYTYPFADITCNHVHYKSKQNISYLVYDSILHKKIILKDTKSSNTKTYDIGRKNLIYLDSDSSKITAYFNTFTKQFKYTITLSDYALSIDTTLLTDKFDDTLIVLKVVTTI